MPRLALLLVLCATPTAAQIAADALGPRRTVAPGLTLRQAMATDPAGRQQCIAVLTVEPDHAGVRLELARAEGLDETSDLARSLGARAAINGGFFTPEERPDGLLRIAGRDRSEPSTRHRVALVLDEHGRPSIARDADGVFVKAFSVLAAGPLLVRRGELPRRREWSDARHPRSAVGLDAGGRLLLVTVDGRADEAAGMTLEELARTLIGLGCRTAMNLDGGGSTTLWVAGAPGNGVVNHPCDDRRFDAAGERRVADALLVFAEPRGEPALDDVERQRRIDLDFALDRPALLAQVRRRVRDFDPVELDGWIERGLLDRPPSGIERYHVAAVSNLFFRDPGLRARRLSGATWHRPPLETRKRTFAVNVRLTVEADAVPPGEEVRAWLPFPQRSALQRPLDDGDVPDAPMRALHRTARAEAGKPVVFTATWVFERRGSDPPAFDPALAALPASRAFTGERPPHVRFAPALRKLAEEIAGHQPNPLLAARAIYDWCADELGYSYAREYSTIPCLPEEVLRTRRGDCGQLTLLFMTLCRLRGIPARWQSGWVVQPGRENLHDWCAIHIEPWGWIPVDVNTAVALNHADGLSAAERERIRDFAFGGLDSYRLLVNRDHGRPLVPPKRSARSDDVDFQRGEVEWGSPARNVYFDRYRCQLTAEELE